MNDVVEYFGIVRPHIHNDPAPLRVGLILRFALTHSTTPRLSDLLDALVYFVPEQREFWLNVEASESEQFNKAMTAMFLADPLTKETNE